MLRDEFECEDNICLFKLLKRVLISVYVIKKKGNIN